MNGPCLEATRPREFASAEEERMRKVTVLVAAATLVAASGSSAAEVVLPIENLRVERVIPLSEIGKAGPSTEVVDPMSIYSNVTTFLGQAIANGGSTGGISRLQMDDATFTTNPGVSNVTTIRFAVTNLNATPQSVRARLRFWNADGAPLGPGLPGAPGTYYENPPATPVGFSFNPFTFAAGVTILSGNLGVGFPVPAGTTTTLWLGITFDNVGTTTGATDAEVNNFGMAFFNPVDRGSSTDTLFLTTAAGSFFPTPNPAGAALTTPNVDNVGWELVVTTLPVTLQGFEVK